MKSQLRLISKVLLATCRSGIWLVGIILFIIGSKGCPWLGNKDDTTGSSQLPKAPASLIATVISPFQINLSWLDQSNNEDGFKIEHKINATGTYTEVGIVGNSTTTYSDRNLCPVTIYYYRIRAYNMYGNSEYSNEVMATTPNGWVFMTSGNMHTVARAGNGTLWSWGGNNFGQLGLGDTVMRTVAFQIGSEADWMHLATGDYHTLALKTSGTLWSWGSNDSGQLGIGNTISKTSPTRVGTDLDWQKISAGATHTIALKIDGTLWSWGSNDSGQLGLGHTISQTAPTRVGTDTDWELVTGGNGYTIALKTDRTLWVWGANSYGQLGLGDTINKTSPVRLDSDSDWSAIAAGNAHTIALKIDGTLWSWGYNEFGQLGLGNTINRDTPMRIGTDADWKTIIVNDDYTTAIKTDGSLWAWGRNDNGQLGIGDTIIRKIPTQIGLSKDWKVVATGDGYTIALKTTGTLWAWGQNNNGQLGIGNTNEKHVPDPVTNIPNIPSPLTVTVISSARIDLFWTDNSGNETGFKVERRTANSGTYYHVATLDAGVTSYQDTDLSPATTYHYRVRATNTFGDSEPSNEETASTIGGWFSLTAGYGHTLACADTGTLWSWGDNYSGQLGIGIKGAGTNRIMPTRISSDTDWSIVLAGGHHTIALKTNHGLWAWGNNQYGQLGLVDWGPGTERTTPTNVGTGIDWKSIAGGDYYTIVLKTNGTLWACGRNEMGQLGFGDTGIRTVMMPVGSDSNWDTISAGMYHTIGLKTNGTIFAWGYNADGELGLGHTNNRLTPTQVDSDTDWAIIATGSYHTIALKTDGTIWTCGSNENGQLGLGNTINKLTLTKIGTDADWSLISAGMYHTVAAKTSGTLWSWGYNFYGQLGLGDSGSFATRTTPSPIGSDSNWCAIAAGDFHTIGLKTTGTLWVWGYNGLGQLGLGDVTDRNTPTRLGE